MSMSLSLNKQLIEMSTVSKYTERSDQQRQSDPYSVHMNGSRAPPWQNSSGYNGKMFIVPTQLKERDEITIKGTLVDGMLDIGLRPYTENLANMVCQLNVVYPEDGQPHNQIEIRAEQNGMLQNFGGERPATDYFNGIDFDVRFTLKSGSITIMVGESYLDSIPFQNNFHDIRFISVKGQVQELNFTFSN